MVTTAAGILFLIGSAVVAALLVAESRAGYRTQLLFLITFSAVVTLYIRIGFGRYFTTIDESYYVSLLGSPNWYISSIVSGYLTPVFLHLFRPLFDTPVDEVIWYSVLMMMVYPGVIFVSYNRLGISKEHSLLAILILFVTPLYIWGAIQIRPQQLGLIIGFIMTVFLLKETGKRRTLIVPILYVLLVFSHVLSFIVYSLVLVLYILVRVLIYGDVEAIAAYRVLAVSVVISWGSFLVFPYSYPLIKNMNWISNRVTGLELSPMSFSILSFGFLVVALLLIYFFIVQFHGELAFLSRIIRRMLMRISENAGENVSPIFALVALIVLFGLLYVQFQLGYKIYTQVYRDSVLTLLLFQAGNLFFAIMYLRGILGTFRYRKASTMDILSVCMVPIALFFLVISFLMPAGKGIWGFHNWLIRALQYFVLFAAPVVARVIKSDMSFRIGTRRILVPMLVGLLITVSILNTARVPAVYNYDAVWSLELPSLCSEGGIYLQRFDVSMYSHFVESNLIKACGGILAFNMSGDVDQASDGFYRYLNKASPVTIGEFIDALYRGGEQPVIIAGKNAQLVMYVASLFSIPSIIQISPEDECPVDSIFPGQEVILIGGPLVNPCTRKLEGEGVFKFSLTPSSVITPSRAYQVATPDPWWNSSEGLFVLYAVRYEGKHIIVVGGTNADSTVAGVYYFVNRIASSPEKYGSVSYVVGKWKETDGTVIAALRGSLRDSNGFSPADSITVLETG